MNFSRFRRLVSRSASSGSVPRCHYGIDIEDASFLVLERELLICPQFKVHSARKDRKMDERVEVSRRFNGTWNGGME